MPRPNAYVCNLTVTHVNRILRVLEFMRESSVQTERAKAAHSIQTILLHAKARRVIGPKDDVIKPLK